MLVLGLLLLLVFVGYYSATRDPVVVRYQVAFANWPAATRPLRVVQMSDIHVSWPDMPTTRLDRIVARVNALEPDLIVLTGDYHGGKIWDREIGDLDVTTRPLRNLHARLGVIAVRGNHDGPYWTPIVFGRLPITLLKNRWIDVGPIIVAGVDDLMGEFDPARAVAGAPSGKPLIMLAHEPDFFNYMSPRVDLLIAGHTHGGQIRFPLVGAVPTGSPFLDAHLRGVFRKDRRRMIVSSGIGTSIIPLRIGVPPEVVEITLGPVTR